jgi:hypothetical protein
MQLTDWLLVEEELTLIGLTQITFVKSRKTSTSVDRTSAIGWIFLQTSDW